MVSTNGKRLSNEIGIPRRRISLVSRIIAIPILELAAANPDFSFDLVSRSAPSLRCSLVL